ncbi:N-6 DNA methylase [Bosea sp. 2KB_26]|uniref:N-6 DNA methylase n=1 Tax=Bosea sp. 2KB_26 TaxID=3237475 RepID=UPI003F8FD3BE
MQFEARKALGAFYTPADLAALFTQWAIDQPGMEILEPSVGSGALVDAVLARFKQVGDGTVTGYEIDEATVCRLDRFRSDPRVHISQADFFDVPAKPTYDLVIANPPFTRNHQLSQNAKRGLRSRKEIQSVVRGASGLWVYFLLACLPHLRPGGRLAFIVPGAVEFADYAQYVLEYLRTTFGVVEIVAIDGAIAWEGAAQERACVLLASGYRRGEAATVLRRCATTQGLIASKGAGSGDVLLAAHTTLGDLAKIEIGSVTGANDVFLLRQTDIEEAGHKPTDFTLAVARARHVRGISVSADDLQSLADRGERTLLFSPEELGERGNAVRSHLAQVGKARRRSTAWFNKRTPWWKVQLGPAFDAVLTYMNHTGPRLALVGPKIAATNTLHKVTFYSRNIEEHRTACVSLLSTYSQLHAETIGRIYGGGVLKFEIKDARRVQLLLPTAPISAAVFARIDTALKAGAFDTARELADAAILPEFYGPGWREAQSQMKVSLMRRREMRGSHADKSRRGTRV